MLKEKLKETHSNPKKPSNDFLIHVLASYIICINDSLSFFPVASQHRHKYRELKSAFRDQHERLTKSEETKSSLNGELIMVREEMKFASDEFNMRLNALNDDLAERVGDLKDGKILSFQYSLCVFRSVSFLIFSHTLSKLVQKP